MASRLDQFWAWVKRRPKWFWDLLWDSEIPLAVTVILTVAAAFLSPMITEKYERQKMRSEYVLANLRELNGLVADVYVQVTAINYAVAAGKKAPEINVAKTREIVARLNWKVIETAAMLRKEDRGPLKRFQQSIVGVSEALDGKLDVKGCQLLLSRVETMAVEAAATIQTVGGRVDLDGEARAQAVTTPVANDGELPAAA